MPELSEGKATDQAPISPSISNINLTLPDVAPIPIPITNNESNAQGVAENTDEDTEDSPSPEPSEETREEARNFIATQMAEDVGVMRKMCEFPELMSLLLTAKSSLLMTDFSVYEVERMFSFPQCSSMLNTVMTALLCTECERRKLDDIPSMPYEVWMPRLKREVSRWYSWYELRPVGQVSVFDIDPRFWKLVGENNPLQTLDLGEIPFKQRVWVVKTLCDNMLSTHPVLRDMCTKMLPEDLRDMRDLGNDAAGNRLFHLRTLAEDDLRVYRVGPGQPETKPASDSKPSASTKERRRGRPRKKKIETAASSPAREVRVTDTYTCTSPNSSYIAETGDFEMVVDSLQSLKELIASYETSTEVPSRPPCEVELIANLLDLLADFQKFEVQLEKRLQRSQCEIFTRWQEHQERSDDFVDPDAVPWRKPAKPSRSSTPDPCTQPVEEPSVPLEPGTEQKEEGHISIQISNVISYAPEVTRSGRKIINRLSSLLEYGELSEDSDATDVWTAPGKKKALKARLPKVQDEPSNGSEVKIKKKRGRKRKADATAAETNKPIEDTASDAPKETSGLTKDSNLANGTLVASEAPVADKPETLTTTAPEPNAVSVIASNDSSCVIISSSANVAPSVDIASLLRSSPSIPGRKSSEPVKAIVKQNGSLPTANHVGQRTPTSIPVVPSTHTQLRTSPGVLRSPNVDHTTPKQKRVPVRRRLAVSPVMTICRGATSITAAPIPPKISSQVTVTAVKKKSEVIVIDSDDDDLPAIRLPSSCSLVRVKKPPPSQAPPLPRLPRSISVTAVNNVRTGKSVPIAAITISDDEDDVVKPVYRVVVSETGQNYAQVLPCGKLRVLSDTEVARIRSQNNGRLLL